MGVMLDMIGKLLAGYLQKEVPGYEPFTPSDPDALRKSLEPGDVLGQAQPGGLEHVGRVRVGQPEGTRDRPHQPAEQLDQPLPRGLVAVGRTRDQLAGVTPLHRPAFRQSQSPGSRR